MLHVYMLDDYKQERMVTTIDKIKQLTALLPMLLFIAGLIALVSAGYLVSLELGTFLLGVALLFCGWLVTPSQSGGDKR